jgi:hypothetical protein
MRASCLLRADIKQNAEWHRAPGAGWALFTNSLLTSGTFSAVVRLRRTLVKSAAHLYSFWTFTLLRAESLRHCYHEPFAAVTRKHL